MSEITDRLNARVVELSTEYERILVITNSDAQAAAVLADQNDGIAVAITAMTALLLKIRTDFPPG